MGDIWRVGGRVRLFRLKDCNFRAGNYKMRNEVDFVRNKKSLHGKLQAEAIWKTLLRISITTFTGGKKVCQKIYYLKPKGTNSKVHFIKNINIAVAVDYTKKHSVYVVNISFCWGPKFNFIGLYCKSINIGIV